MVLGRSDAPYAPCLSLAILIGKGTPEQIERQAGLIGNPFDDLRAIHMAAVVWSEEVVGSA